MLTHLTPDAVLAFDPCEKYTKEHILSLSKGKESFSLLEILEHPDIHYDDKIWIICHKDVLSEKEHMTAGLRFTRRVEHLHPTCKPTLDVLERYIKGEASEEEMEETNTKIWEWSEGIWTWAGSRAGRWAAETAVRAAGIAAWKTERKAQVEILKDIIKEREVK